MDTLTAMGTTPLALLATRPTVSVSEAAQILSISRGQAYAMARSGEIALSGSGRGW